MYRPTAFQVDDPNALRAFMLAHPLATFISATGGEISTTQVPFVVREGAGSWSLIGHLARSNPHWQAIAPGAMGVAVFSAARHYITPSWYAGSRESGMVVPTYDYVLVEARGTLRVTHDRAELRAFVEILSGQEEGRIEGSWTTESIPDEYLQRQLGGIVGIELRISSVVGSFKLSQNKSQADIQGVVAGLNALGDASAKSIADLIAGATHGS